MNKITQKESVYRAIKRYAIKNKLTGVARFKVYDQLEKDFLSGKAEFKLTESNLMKLADRRLLRSYIQGLVSNWLIKDERLKKVA